MDQIYFNTAATGLIIKEASEISSLFNNNLTQNASYYAEKWMFEELPSIRTKAAEFLHAKEAELCFVPNTSFAVNSVGQTIKHHHQKVLLLEGDYPSLTLPFELNEFQIFRITSNDGFGFDMSEIKERIVREGIEVVAVSHVQWMTGYQLNIKELCEFCDEHHVVTIIDVTQSIGAIPIDFTALKADVIIGSIYKWLNSGFGGGIMCVREKFMSKNPPRIGGFASFKFENKVPQYEPSIKSYEPGHQNMSGLLILKESIIQKMNRGMDFIQTHNQNLTQSFLSGLRSYRTDLIGPSNLENRSSILCFRQNTDLEEKLNKAGVVFTSRMGKTRLSFHHYNTIEEVNKVLDLIQ